MRLIRSTSALIPGMLALAILSATGCLGDSTPTQNFVLGRVQVVVTDAGGAPVPQVRLNLTLTDKSTWRAALTGSDGMAEFGATEGGVIIQPYLVHIILPIQYEFAPNETNDKSVVPIENQITVIQFRVAKTDIIPPA